MPPNPGANDVDSYHISYVRPSKGKLAAVAISMPLDDDDDTDSGKGAFQKKTPQGRARVKWHRKWVNMEKDEYGQPVDSDKTLFILYSLTIDSPAAVPVRLETQQHYLRALHLNGHLVQFQPFLSEKWDVNKPYSADQRLALTFPGGHNVLALRLSYWSIE